VIFQIVRFKSRLSDDQVLATYRERAPRYQALPGLIQKYYLKYADTGEHGAIYLWESDQAMQDFRASDLARSIPDAYQVEGAPDVQTGAHVMSLRPEASARTASR
jgi:heme-degrading monooxygenase HmoA